MIHINLLLIALIIIIIILFYLFKMKNYNDTNISALSYLAINDIVPKKELLLKFVDNYNDKKYKNYFNKLINLNLIRKPVYVIKKINDQYEYEVYFYRYDPFRDSKYNYKHCKYFDISLDNYDNFIKKSQLDSLNIKAYQNKLFGENDFIIVSCDINDNFFKSGPSFYSYYFYNEEDKHKHRYLIKEEYNNGNIITTNTYGLFYSIFEREDRNKYLIDLFETEDCIIFYGYKSKTDLHAFYYENLNFDKFIAFLIYFKYDIDIINFCKENYNNNYKFCVSYDMDKNYIPLKSAIFSIF
jgi:hypothetical protein